MASDAVAFEVVPSGGSDVSASEERACAARLRRTVSWADAQPNNATLVAVREYEARCVAVPCACQPLSRRGEPQ